MLTSQILLQLIVILLVVQFFGYLARFIGQQWVVGEILAGLALGPSLLGHFLPGMEQTVFPISALPTLQTLGDIGLILYMFSLGANIDIHLMVRQSRKAGAVSVCSIALPLIMGAVLAYFLFPDLAGANATLFSFMFLVGTAISLTAFPVLARILTERDMLNTQLGTLALTSAAANDIIAWCLLALIIAIVHASGTASALITIGVTFLFIGVMIAGIRPLLLLIDRRIPSKPLILAITVILLLLSAYTTSVIGVHPVLGAFMMGIIVPRKTLFIDLVHSIDKTNGLLFLPLYFVYTGLRTQLGLISSPTMWLICLVVLVVACSGKIFGAAFSARMFGDSWKEALGLGMLMNARGLVGLIVLNIGLDLGVLSPTLFTILMLMAVLTTMLASPVLPLLGYGQKRQINKKITRVLDKDAEGQVITN
ncbi:MAG TPA: cation:proton antiporter [Ktedonobacteraceae bacterium]|nr:cation:proton antiporter [Ktedonobacteraceae bacterium]